MPHEYYVVVTPSGPFAVVYSTIIMDGLYAVPLTWEQAERVAECADRVIRGFVSGGRVWFPLRVAVLDVETGLSGFVERLKDAPIEDRPLPGRLVECLGSG